MYENSTIATIIYQKNMIKSKRNGTTYLKTSAYEKCDNQFSKLLEYKQIRKLHKNSKMSRNFKFKPKCTKKNYTKIANSDTSQSYPLLRTPLYNKKELFFKNKDYNKYIQLNKDLKNEEDKRTIIYIKKNYSQLSVHSDKEFNNILLPLASNLQPKEHSLKCPTMTFPNNIKVYNNIGSNHFERNLSTNMKHTDMNNIENMDLDEKQDNIVTNKNILKSIDKYSLQNSLSKEIKMSNNNIKFKNYVNNRENQYLNNCRNIHNNHYGFVSKESKSILNEKMHVKEQTALCLPSNDGLFFLKPFCRKLNDLSCDYQKGVFLNNETLLCENQNKDSTENGYQILETNLTNKKTELFTKLASDDHLHYHDSENANSFYKKIYEDCFTQNKNKFEINKKGNRQLPITISEKRTIGNKNINIHCYKPVFPLKPWKNNIKQINLRNVLKQNPFSENYELKQFSLKKISDKTHNNINNGLFVPNENIFNRCQSEESNHFPSISENSELLLMKNSLNNSDTYIDGSTEYTRLNSRLSSFNNSFSINKTLINQRNTNNIIEDKQQKDKKINSNQYFFNDKSGVIKRKTAENSFNKNTSKQLLFKLESKLSTKAAENLLVGSSLKTLNNNNNSSLFKTDNIIKKITPGSNSMDFKLVNSSEVDIISPTQSESLLTLKHNKIERYFKNNGNKLKIINQFSKKKSSTEDILTINKNINILSNNCNKNFTNDSKYKNLYSIKNHNADKSILRNKINSISDYRLSQNLAKKDFSDIVNGSTNEYSSNLSKNWPSQLSMSTIKSNEKIILPSQDTLINIMEKGNFSPKTLNSITGRTVSDDLPERLTVSKNIDKSIRDLLMKVGSNSKTQLTEEGMELNSNSTSGKHVSNKEKENNQSINKCKQLINEDNIFYNKVMYNIKNNHITSTRSISSSLINNVYIANREQMLLQKQEMNKQMYKSDFFSMKIIYLNYDMLQKSCYDKIETSICQPSTNNYDKILVHDFIDFKLIDREKMIRMGLNKIASDPSLKIRNYNLSNVLLVMDQKMKDDVITKIYIIFKRMIENSVNGMPSKFKLLRMKTWNDLGFKNNMVLLKGQHSVIGCEKKIHRRKFFIIMFIMAKISEFLRTNIICTTREIYYQYKQLFKTQYQVQCCINEVCRILDILPWHTGIISTGKSLVYGKMFIKTQTEEINCNITGGILVPQNVKDIIEFNTNASFILIVEKDSIFQKLLTEDLPNKLIQPFIIITGKGYADINLRLFLRKLNFELNIPMFILVDGDPYGIDIMLQYRFGSLGTSYISKHLVLPNIRWIGIHPSEMSNLSVQCQKLTENDKRKIESMLLRPYMNDHPKIKEELEIFLSINRKAELEGLIRCEDFFSNLYFPKKLYSQEYI